MKKRDSAKSPKKNRPRILVAHRGPSQIDGRPVRAIAYCLEKGSLNRKTGPMAQILICRDDMQPYDAIRTGADISVCGNCPLRPANSGGCYVNLGAYFPRVFETSNDLPADLAGACQAIRDSGLPLRIGSWGDPTAVPLEVITALTDAARGSGKKPRHTAYTSGWRDHPEYQDIAMASVMNEKEQAEAEGLGFRTFRLLVPESSPLPGEIACPAGADKEHEITCSACLLCSGNARRGKNVTVLAHGSADKVRAVKHLINKNNKLPK